jgi:hypothetical protein
MPRIAGVGLAYSTFMLLLSSSAAPQEPARTGAEAGSGVVRHGHGPHSRFLALGRDVHPREHDQENQDRIDPCSHSVRKRALRLI